MSLHILTHPWDVREAEDGLVVYLSPRDLDAATLAVLADELSQLALESGRPRLLLDLSAVHSLAEVALGKLRVLKRRLGREGVQMVLRHLDPELRGRFEGQLRPA
jgi:anti-anti-sigma regulatory factor